MAFAERFNSRLQQQFQAAGARIIHLEATTAHQHDQLAERNTRIQRLEAEVHRLNTEIQRLTSATISSSGPHGVTQAVQTQINQATTRAMSAENKLKESVQRFNKVHAQLQLEKQNLKKELEALKSSGVGAELAKVKTENERLRKAYAALEKQFQVEKRQKGSSFPASAKGKAVTASDDEDDEEEMIASLLKQEPIENPAAGPSAAASPKFFSQHPPQLTVPPSPAPFNQSVPDGPPAFYRPEQRSPYPSFSQPPAPPPPRMASNSRIVHGLPVHGAPPRPGPHTGPRSKCLPTPPQSLREGSTASNITVNQRPRANAIDYSSTLPNPRPGKRRRQNEQDEIKQELQDLEITDPKAKATLEKRGKTKEVINLCNTPTPPPPAKRPRTTSNDADFVPSPASTSRGSDIEESFIFKAITDYHQAEDPEDEEEVSFSYLHSHDDLADAAAALWDSIRSIHDVWEEAKGTDWAYEFQVKLKDRNSRQCVSSKLKILGRESGRSKWRPGCEGRFACRDCAREGRPCFVWSEENEFRLLPLHDEDRVWPVREGLEVRRWINVE